MYVNHSKKLIFIHIPKNGGTSVLEAMREVGGWHHIFVLHEDWFKDKIDENHNGHLASTFLKGLPYDHFETISIARNPWSRQLSIYLFWINQMRKIMAGIPLDEGNGKFNRNGTILDHNPHAFDDWVEREHTNLIVGGFRGWIMDRDVSQYNATGLSLNWVDETRAAKHHWFKLEDKAALKQMTDMMGLPTLQKHNVTQHLHYTRYYEPEMVELVRTRYEQDIRRFGYEFG